MIAFVHANFKQCLEQIPRIGDGAAKPKACAAEPVSNGLEQWTATEYCQVGEA